MQQMAMQQQATGNKRAEMFLKVKFSSILCSCKCEQ
uniref:Uncharacterized protein n=1 Tax=Anguilla anguilla TaxID=7936 RepID=A0A0E9S490_ANGAN